MRADQLEQAGMKTDGKLKGFTLIELMIVVAIVAILAGIAYPSYQDSVRKARRADATEVLMRVAQAQERHFTQFGRYASSLEGGAVSAENLGMTAASLDSEGGFSTVSLSNAGTTTYTLTATITPADPDCGDLTLNQIGEKGESGSKDVDFCW